MCHSVLSAFKNEIYANTLHIYTYVFLKLYREGTKFRNKHRPRGTFDVCVEHSLISHMTADI